VSECSNEPYYMLGMAVIALLDGGLGRTKSVRANSIVELLFHVVVAVVRARKPKE
jgi:hypothetical protein